MRKSGLTIVELILVIMTVALLAAIVTPVFQTSVPRITLRSGAREIMAEMRHVQQQAITASTTFYIRFKMSPKDLVISYLDEEGNVQTDHTFRFDESVSIFNTTFPGHTLELNLLGEPSEGGDVIVQNGRGDQVTIRVTSSIGKISLIE
jgi:type II secretory pathway pseudopilin PulG